MGGTLDPAGVARVLGRLSIRAEAADAAPLMIVACQRATVLWANPAARLLLNTDDLSRAGHFLFGATPAARAFAARLCSPSPQPQFERLRLGGGWTSVPSLVSWRGIDDEEGSESLAVLQWGAPVVGDDLPAAPHAADGESEAVQPASPAPDGRVPEGLRTRRVLWAADDRGVITAIDADFARLAGRTALAVGDHLPSRLTSIDPVVGAAVERLLVHGGAFVTARVAWPRGAGDPISLQIGCARRRGSSGGLRGFCVLHGSPEELVADGTRADDAAPSSTQHGPPEPDVESGLAAPDAVHHDPISMPAPLNVAASPAGSDAQATFAAPPASPGSNVVHFPAMRIASVPANFGSELRSLPPVPRQTAEPESENLVVPRWSEAPDADAPSAELSADEQDAFAHIGEVLGTKPSAGRSRSVSFDDAEAEPAALVASVLDALPIALLWQVDGVTGANQAFRTRTGFADGALPDDLVSFEPSGSIVRLAGQDGQPIEARVLDTSVRGLAAKLVTVPEPPQAPADRGASGATVGDPGEGVPSALALDIAADGHAMLDDDGTIARISPGGARLFGYEPADLIGRRITDLAAPDTEDAWTALLRVEGGEIGRRDLTGRARSGQPVPVSARVGRVAANGLLVAWSDDGARQRTVSGLEASRREAERTSALKSEFLAKVSHEIRTPLSAIIGFAEVIRDERLGPVGNSRYLDYMRDIHASGTHVLSLVNDLLDLSRIEAGRMDLRLESVDANAIVNACVSALQTQAHRERIIVRLSLTPGLPSALADERSMRQIVLNLLSNAIKFNEPGGQVIVSTALADSDAVTIRIRDTGIGMTDDEIETAMEPFRQVSTEKRTGSGLGLPVTKALVEANCASMTIRSKPGQGTLVEVGFPVVERNSMCLPAE